MRTSGLLFIGCFTPGLVAGSWGTLPRNTSISIRATNVTIPSEAVDSLIRDISHVQTFTRTYENSNETSNGYTQYGLSIDWFHEAIDHWRQTFDWRKTEESINRHPHFFAEIASNGNISNKVHFMALFSQNPNAIPVILFHGWPGSFLEFAELFDIVKSRYQAASSPFHLIVPSLPGFTLSGGPPIDTNWGIANTSALMDTLMHGLGFQGGYIAQGGDIGSFVAQTLGRTSTSCKAIHLNFIPSIKPDSVPPPDQDPSLTIQDREILARSQRFVNTEQAYALEQGSKPATLGLVLESSPVGLFAWIGEKFLAWTDPSKTFTFDQILSSISLYHLTSTISRSLYAYKETSSSLAPSQGVTPQIKVPFGYSRFPYDNSGVPKSWAQTLGNLTFFSAHTRGGHFAAMEYPEDLWNDIETFVFANFPTGFTD